MRHGRTGKIRIGVRSGPGAVLIMPLLEIMATKHPSVPSTCAFHARELDALVIDARR